MLFFTARMLGHMAHGAMLRVRGQAGAAPMPFRCYPVDLDIYGHMNNASFLRVAELCRWKQMAMTGLVTKSLQEGWMFIIAEQSIRYSKPVNPFQRYSIRSELAVDGKWVLYHHYFESASSQKSGERRLFAHIEMRAVVKHVSGKTIQPSEILAQVPDLASWVTPTGPATAGAEEVAQATADDQRS